MSLLAWVQGRPFRQPVHPMLVHFPIGFFVLTVLFDLGGRLFSSLLAFDECAWWTLVAGLVTALPTAAFGLIDWFDIRRDHAARPIATRHMVLNLVAVGLFAVSALLRGGSSPTPTSAIALSLSALALLGYSGYLGGDLVYNHGIAVGRHRRASATSEETLVVSVVGADGWTDVMREEDLQPDRPRRIAVGETVFVLVRDRDGLAAIQEFCTHRFGPLSEGCFRDGFVICPWHRSRFNVRTGEVLEGPAKLPLRSFPVEIREGRVFVRIDPGPVQ